MEVGTVLSGKLRVERVLGRGGMGVVVVAKHLQLNQLVAVKVLRDELAHDRATVERFLREGQASARLRSDHVCRVFDVGTLDSGAPYLVMELLEGADLAAVIRQRPLPIADAVDVTLQACEAIAEAHALGIVHRDLKPANLFVSRRLDGTSTIKVLDFGIAKAPDNLELTHTSTVMGSPGYMSPEQLRSARDVDMRTDIWSLGVILYQCVSGRLPFSATSITEMAVKVLVEPPDPLRIDPRFDAIVMRCLEKDRERRYPTVAVFAIELATCGGPTAAARAAGVASILGHHQLAMEATAVSSSAGAPMATGSPLAPTSPIATGASIARSPIATGASVSPVALTAARPTSRRALYAIGAVVVAAIVIALAARKPAGVPAGWGPRPGPGDEVGQRAHDFALALYEHRCDDARAVAKTLSASHVAQADACVPLKNRAYPLTLAGAEAAQADRRPDQALAIAEGLLARTPDDPSLLKLAGLAACEVRDSDKAQRYVPRIVPLDDRSFIVEQCRQFGVVISTP